MKNSSTFKNAFSLLFLLVSSVSFGQTIIQRTCDFDQSYNLLKNKYSNFDKFNRTEIQEDTKENLSGRLVDDTSTYEVRVVVHIIYMADTKYQNLSDEIVASQIDALNRDYNLWNDYSTLRPEFVPFIGNAKIQFKLATTDPNGNPTTGIERRKGELGTATTWGILGGENQKQFSKGGLDAWTTSKYLNIWVCDLNYGTDGTEGYLGGYAFFPSYFYPIALFPRQMDGASIDYRFFGQHNWFNIDSLNGSDNYGLGRTTVHEIGHYLGLFHAWGNVLDPVNYSTGCVEDDEIKDTPNSKKPYATYYVEPRNICDTIVNSCGTLYNGVDYDDMFENYMDYSTDRCYSLFTAMQVKRMRSQLVKYREGIINDKFVTSINQTAAFDKKFEIYPNPSKGLFQVKIKEDINSPINVRVLNSLGAVVLEKQIPSNLSKFDIDLSALSKSMYLINFTSNGITTTKKVIIN